jgi:hypothetical protein
VPSVITFVTRLHIEQLVLPSWLTGRASILPIVTGQTYGSCFRGSKASPWLTSALALAAIWAANRNHVWNELCPCGLCASTR